jgi:eukaryotic-like serine/threonine-protein kinase
LTPERWAQIEELFHRAAECDPAVRSGLLDNACSDDPSLRKEVEALLARDGGVAAAAMEASVRTELHNLVFPWTGETVSHYRILNGLGGGGMGLVYRAQDIKLARRVALKFLPEESAKDPDALRRFEREAQSASALEHPNICPIYEFGEHEGQPFIVMPLLEGQTVEQFIHGQGAPKGPQQIQKVLDLASQVLKGLEAAHEHGIIHRDIKPGNIFLTADGQAKILDFGVAKLTHAEIEEDDHRDHDAAETTRLVKGIDLTLSRTGAVLGTAAYMSPEQVRGERVDARTDIFSLGLVLYEMATGKRAFGGNTWPVLQEALLRATPKPVRGSNPEIPARLETIINKALEKDRAERYQTASQMLADLEALQGRLAPRQLPRAWAAGLGIAAAILIATFAVVLMKKPRTVSVVPEIKLSQLTINSSENPVIGGAISPDGKYLAYSDTRGLHIKLLDTGETRMVPKPEALKDQSVKWEVGFWFPDSTRFLTNLHLATEEWSEWSSVNGSVWAVSVLGGAPTKLRDHAVVAGVSPDGSLVSFGTNKGKFGEREIWLMRPNGEQARKLYEVKGDSSMCCLGWSPDGKRYWYVLTSASGDTMLSRDANGGPPITVLPSSEMKNVKDILWLHDGRVVYALAEPGKGDVCNYWTLRLNVATGNHLEGPRRLTNWPSFCVTSSSVTNDDRRLAFTGFSGFFTSYVADLEAGGKGLRNTRHFTLEDSDDAVHGWTADGKLLVAQHRKDGWGLYRQSLESDTPEPIVSSVAGGALLIGATTPDGKWYIGRIWPDAENVQRPTIPLSIVRIPLAGGSPETILQLSRNGNVSCARPPSNICVISEQSEDRKQMIVSIFDPLKGRGPELARFDFARELETLEVPTCVISPDGTRLAVARSPESPIEIYSLYGQLMRAIPSQSVGELIWLAWSANQKGLFVTRKAQRGNELLYLDVQGNVTSSRNCIGSETCFGFPSPDGRHLAVIDRNQSANMWMMENF